jgi:hypothetical protein
MNVVLTFYRNFIWPVTFISLISCYLLFDGSAKDVVYLFWMKIITNLFMGIYFEIFHPNQFYFFYNLGYSKTNLYIGVAIVDLSVWLLLTLSMLLI